MFCIFLDDERDPKDVTWIDYGNIEEFHIARNPEEFKNIVMSIAWMGKDIVYSFDHDIQCFNEEGQETTGKQVLEWLIFYYHDSGLNIPNCVFHTQNPIGKKNMECYYQNALNFF